MAVVEVAREASTEATGELVTRGHFDTALAQLEFPLGWRLVTAGIAISAVVVAALRFLTPRHATPLRGIKLRHYSWDSLRNISEKPRLCWERTGR